MIKQLIIVLFCFLALAHGKYVIQRLFQPQDINCEKPLTYGSFIEENKCSGHNHNAGIFQKHSCNSTHVTVHTQCNSVCTVCLSKFAYPREKCVPGFVGTKITCESDLPDVNEKGVYIRQHINEQCKNEAPGDFGTFITDEYCQNAPNKKDLFGIVVNLGKNIKSSKAFYDKSEKLYKLQTFDDRDCKGSIIQAYSFKLNVCVNMPGAGYSKLFNQKIFQPSLYAIFSRKD
eukprot:gene2729-3924_t